MVMSLVVLLLLTLLGAVYLTVQRRSSAADRRLPADLRAARRAMRSAARLQRRSAPRDYNLTADWVMQRGF
jgi:hypothetical protein